MSQPILVIGAGGHAKVLVAALKLQGAHLLGCLAAEPAPPVLGLPVLGGDEVLDAHPPAAVLLANGIGGVRPGGRRPAVFAELAARGYRFVRVVHPHAFVAEDVELAEGAQVMAGAVIQPGCRIGAGAIVNTRAAVDHDCRIGAHAHLAPGVTLSGGVVIGDGAHLGTGAVVIEGRRIGAGALVAAGAVVVADVPDGAVVKGVPARG